MGLEDDLLRDLEGDDEDVVEEGFETGEADGDSSAQAEDVMSTHKTKLSSKRKHDSENGHADGDTIGEDGEEDDMHDLLQVKEEESEQLVPEGGTKPAEELQQEDVDQMQLRNVKDVSSVARLAGSKVFKEVLQKVGEYSMDEATDISSADSPEYKLIVQANNMAVEVDNEVMIVQKFVRDNYSARFPELETLVDNPYDYIRAAQAIGNPPELEDLASELQGTLPPAMVMVVTVEATTTRGKQMSTQQWEAVEKAARMCFELDDARRRILEYVESRVRFLAPNLSAIVGSRTATKLLGIAGGLSGLAKMPSSSIFLLGAQKKAPAGFSTSARVGNPRHTGFIFQSDVVQSMPPEYRMKAQRTVGAKCTLACRMDQQRAYSDGSYGRQLREDVERRLEKLAEPPPTRITKALPTPIEGSKKRRGGKRARKAKEAYAQTELSKLRNRMMFGQEEEEVGAYDETEGMGMIGSSSGKIRQMAGESRTKAKMSKTNKNRIAALRGSSSGLQSGLASSVSFTPVEGIEIRGNQTDKRVQDANASWFAEGAFSVVSRPTGASSTMVPIPANMRK